MHLQISHFELIKLKIMERERTKLENKIINLERVLESRTKSILNLTEKIRILKKQEMILYVGILLMLEYYHFWFLKQKSDENIKKLIEDAHKKQKLILFF